MRPQPLGSLVSAPRDGRGNEGGMEDPTVEKALPYLAWTQTAATNPEHPHPVTSPFQPFH